MKQVGGRLLGQGVYGCTFSPAPRCAGGRVFDRIGDLPAVGKITSEDSREELGVGRAIMALPLARNYFALPSESCQPELPVRDPDVNDCRVVTESEGSTKFSMLIMPAAGTQLIRYAEQLGRLGNTYVDMFVHLLEGMVIYQNAGYVHNDIHMGNVLVDERGVARFIDFGLAFKPAEIQAWEDSHLGTRFRPKYVWQAPEVHAWRMRLNGVRVADGAAQLLQQNDEWRRVQDQFAGRLPLVSALTGFLNEVGSDGIAMLRRYAKGFDCWRIGLMFWMLWMDLMAYPARTQTAAWQHRDTVRSVLSGLTDFDPRARWTAQQALTALDPNNRLAGPASSAGTGPASGKPNRTTARSAPVSAKISVVEE